jgi:hypothetical protein
MLCGVLRHGYIWGRAPGGTPLDWRADAGRARRAAAPALVLDLEVLRRGAALSWRNSRGVGMLGWHNSKGYAEMLQFQGGYAELAQFQRRGMLEVTQISPAEHAELAVVTCRYSKSTSWWSSICSSVNSRMSSLGSTW